MIRKVLFGCGVASSLLYVGMNIAGALLYPDYDVFSQQVSEPSAIGDTLHLVWAPSRCL